MRDVLYLLTWCNSSAAAFKDLLDAQREEYQKNLCGGTRVLIHGLAYSIWDVPYEFPGEWLKGRG